MIFVYLLQGILLQLAFDLVHYSCEQQSVAGRDLRALRRPDPVLSRRQDEIFESSDCIAISTVSFWGYKEQLAFFAAVYASLV